MDVKITEKKEEGPLSRVRLAGEIIFEAVTPSYEEVRKKISSSVDCDEKLIVIKNIYTKFGLKKARRSAIGTSCACYRDHRRLSRKFR